MRFVGIDPSTKTGFVALDGQGQVIKAKELTGLGNEDPKRMVTLIDEIMDFVHPAEDFIVIEGFPFSTQRAMFAGGLHHGIRNALFIRNVKFTNVAPNAVKKYVGVTGWIGEPGSKRRLKDKEKKRAVMAAVKEHFGFVHKSDNVVDAYIMAHIARELFLESDVAIPRKRLSYQEEVIQSILDTKKAKAK